MLTVWQHANGVAVVYNKTKIAVDGLASSAKANEWIAANRDWKPKGTKDGKGTAKPR